MTLFHVLVLNQVPIYRQLQIEEALLRADERNWCILNTGSIPSIVLGISGIVEELVDVQFYSEKPIPLIRRFSGGGTVLVDENTTFVTWICNAEEIQIGCSPREIIQWTGNFYQPLFANLPFAVRENDYVLGERKFGGNAQYLCKKRWLHHTSFLWDYDQKLMRYLLLPKKMPSYRNQRSHADFLCRLKEHHPDQKFLTAGILEHLKKRFKVKEETEVSSLLLSPHRKTTCLINL